MERNQTRWVLFQRENSTSWNPNASTSYPIYWLGGMKRGLNLRIWPPFSDRVRIRILETIWMVFLVYFADFSVKWKTDTLSATPVVFLHPVVAHWCLYDSPKELISLFTFMQDLGRTTFQEGSFIGGNIRFPRVGFFLPFQAGGSNLAYLLDCYMAMPCFWSSCFAGFGRVCETTPAVVWRWSSNTELC